MDKETTNLELVASNRCGLVVVVLEIGGRWSEEAVVILGQLAFAKAREALPAMKWQVVHGLGTPLDPHVGRDKRGDLCSFLGGTV